MKAEIKFTQFVNPTANIKYGSSNWADAGQFSDNDHLYLPTIKLNEQQLDSSVYTVEHGRVQQARHMHPVKAGASTRERLRGRSLHAYWNTGSRALSCNIGSM